MKLKDILLTLFVLLIAITILTNASVTGTATKEAIQTCITTVVPSLMTFMVLTSFVSESPVGDALGGFLPTRFLFNLPSNCAKAIILSAVGGYPCGAKIVADMLKKEEIDIKTAQRMMNFCVNASPAYVISAIGIGIFGSAKIGVIIWLSHIITAFFIGIAFRGKYLPQKPTHRPYLPAAQNFVKSVFDGTNTMVAISGFVIVFSVILALLERVGITEQIVSMLTYLTKNENTSKAIFDAMLDVVVGSKSCAECSPITAVVLCAGAVSFGGLSIWSQIAYMFSGQKINFLQIILFRFVHAVLTAAAVYIIINVTDTHITTANILGSNVNNTSVGYVTTALFLACCICFVIVADKSISLIMQRRKNNEV